MKGHVGAVLTSGLALVALALALLQAAVLFAHRMPRAQAAAAAARGPSNRYSAPGGRSGIPWLPFEEKAQPVKAPEGRSPAKQQPEEHRTPPPPRPHKFLPSAGPRPPRRAVA